MMQEDDAEDLGGEYHRETFNDEVTDIEKEDTGEPPPEAKPWDPEKIRISTKWFALRHIVEMIRLQEIDLAPEFQRNFIWSSAQESAFIESILLGIPVPAFYFNQDVTGTMQVVDGVQRLVAIERFVRGERLSSMQYLKQLEGKRFDDLEPNQRRRFQQTQVLGHIIEPQTPDEVKFEVFKRINTGGNPLTSQEIRHCISRARSRELLATLTALPSFHAATGYAFRNERRMVDREFALRFCAFRSLETIEKYGEFQNVDTLLLDFIRQVDGTHRVKPRLADDALTKLQDDFDRAMRTAVAVWGSSAFRKYPTGARRLGPLNRALFESWAVAVADYEPVQLEPHKDAIIMAVRKLMQDSAYNEAISHGTSAYPKVHLRFFVAREIITMFGGASK